jgi:hypothetical protein
MENFHRAIDVRPDFCDVIVETCCILHNFVREAAFSFRIHYTNVPSRVLRLLALVVMLQEGPCENTLRNIFTSLLGSVPWQYEEFRSTLYYKHKMLVLFRTNTVQLTTHYIVLLYIIKVLVNWVMLSLIIKLKRMHVV